MMFTGFSYGHTATLGHDSSVADIIVVELFTSQGCNSCPPADDILADLAKQDNILALSYSVDYWNYMGWEDTLAQPDCTLRQKNYNRALGKSGVYTPQMIIQGKFAVIGSREKLIHETMVQAKAGQKTPPSLSFVAVGDNIQIEVGENRSEKRPQATIWVIGYDYAKKVHIKSGELSGQVRTYHNVVQAIKKIGHWTGAEMKISLSPSDIEYGQYDDFAVLLQYSDAGPIIAAAKLR